MRALKKIAVPEWALVVLILGLFGWHLHEFWGLNGSAENAINAARDLRRHAEFPFAAGRPSFLWTLFLTVFAYIDVNLARVSLYSGALFGVGALALSVACARRLRLVGNWAYLPALVLAAHPVFARAISGGAEMPLFVAEIALCFYLYLRADSDPRWYPALGGVAGLALLTRPEALFFAIPLILHRGALILIRDKRRPPDVVLWGLGMFAIIFGIWFAWHWARDVRMFPKNMFDVKINRADFDYLIRRIDVLFALPWMILSLVVRQGTIRFVFSTLAALTFLFLPYTSGVAHLWIAAVMIGLGAYHVKEWTSGRGSAH